MALAGDEKSLTLVVDSNLSHTVVVAMAVRGMCDMTCLTPVEVDRLELCLIEALNNVIVHAYQNHSGHRVGIYVVLSRTRVSLTISDCGRTMPDKYQAIVVGAAGEKIESDSFQAGGRGLLIIRNLMDDVRYSSEEGENSLFMMMNASQS